MFSYGHRNSQGLDWEPDSGLQFQTEHGPSGFDGPGGGDEVNIVEAGKNYGWPVVHHRERAPERCRHCSSTRRRGAVGRLVRAGSCCTRSPATSSSQCLRGERLIRVRFDPGPAARLETEELFKDVYGRLRDVIFGPDGAMYVATSNRDGRGRRRPGDDRILRVVESPAPCI